MIKIKLKTGKLDANNNLDGWVITSPTAVAYGAEDIILLRGDAININGDVKRDGKIIANIF